MMALKWFSENEEIPSGSQFILFEEKRGEHYGTYVMMYLFLVPKGSA